MGSENRTGQYEFSPDPDLNNLLTVWARKIGLAIRTASVGTVTSYNATKQEAGIIVDILQVQKVTQQIPGGVDPNEVNQVVTAAPIALANVPVIFPGAGDGSSYTTYPIVPGCTGLLVVLDRSKDTWVNRTAAVPVDPVKSAIHSLADCVFIPGLTDRLHRITPSAGTLIATVIESAQIYIGKESTPTTSVAIAERVVDAVTATLNSLIGTFGGPPAPVTNVQLVSAFTTALGIWQGLASTLASSKAKVAP